jgi:hypothetical protein
MSSSARTSCDTIGDCEQSLNKNTYSLWGPISLLSYGYRRGKTVGRETDLSLPKSAEFEENMDLYIHSFIHLHGVVPN